LALGARIVEVLKQKNNAPVDAAHQVCIIYAVVNGYLNSIPVEKISEYEKQLFAHMDNYGYDALTTIRTKGVLDEAAENTLKAALAVLNERFVSVS